MLHLQSWTFSPLSSSLMRPAGRETLFAQVSRTHANMSEKRLSVTRGPSLMDGRSDDIRYTRRLGRSDWVFNSVHSTGVCYTSRECRERGGTPSGACATGFGVCCVCKFSQNCLTEYLALRCTICMMLCWELKWRLVVKRWLRCWWWDGRGSDTFDWLWWEWWSNEDDSVAVVAFCLQ